MLFNKILVVCIGNICRSPVAEALLKIKLGDKVVVTSAGLSAMVGKGAAKHSVDIMAKQSINIDSHLAKQISLKMINESDLILVMEKFHLEEISRICPQARGKTKLLTEWIGRKDIPDPYNKSYESFSYTLDLIEKSVNSWLTYLN